jgi:hypothetical protein
MAVSLAPSSWDVRTFASTLAMGALLFGVACAIGGATDEGSIAWSMRAARAVPLVPVCGAVVTFLALRRAERRGELLALESIGCSPARSAAFAVAAAAAMSLACAASVAFWRGPSLDAFFPRATAHGDVRVEGAEFFDAARGVRVGIGGEMKREKPVASSAIAPELAGRAASAAIVVALLGIALPLLSARGARRASAAPVGVAGAMCALCIFLLQAGAAGRAPPALATLPAAALLIYAGLRYRSAAW